MGNVGGNGRGGAPANGLGARVGCQWRHMVVARRSSGQGDCGRCFPPAGDGLGEMPGAESVAGLGLSVVGGAMAAPEGTTPSTGARSADQVVVEPKSSVIKALHLKRRPAPNPAQAGY